MFYTQSTKGRISVKQNELIKYDYTTELVHQHNYMLLIAIITIPESCLHRSRSNQYLATRLGGFCNCSRSLRQAWQFLVIRCRSRNSSADFFNSLSIFLLFVCSRYPPLSLYSCAFIVQIIIQIEDANRNTCEPILLFFYHQPILF